MDLWSQKTDHGYMGVRCGRDAPHKGAQGNFGGDGNVHFKWLQFIVSRLHINK